MTDWKRKIQAFLYNLPDRALDVNGASARAGALLQTVLGNGSTQEVQQADRWACGLDVPPFVQDVNPDVTAGKLLLRHPLSGEEKEIVELSTSDKDKAFKTVQQAVQGIHDAYQGDHKEKELFLALWRLLPEVIRDQDQGSPLRDYWQLMPYDPRLPDHSIWDHQALTSALATTADGNGVPKPALLIFGLGSAQSFLAMARRTQDLWMGSFLLSYLMWEMMKPLVNKYGPDCVIYPNLRGQPLVDRWLREEMGLKDGSVEICEPEADELKIANFPNMFTAVVPQDQAQKIAQDCIAALQEQWQCIATSVQKIVQAAYQQARGFPLSEDMKWNEAWERQIPDLTDRLGVFWVAYPWGEDPQSIFEHDYTRLIGDTGEANSVYKLIQEWLKVVKDDPNGGMAYPLVSALAARFYSSRKNLRDFQQTEEPGEKCSQCGVREALHPELEQFRKHSLTYENDAEEARKLEKAREQALLRRFWESLERIEVNINGNKVKLEGRIRRGDRLCAVCLTKRLAWEHFFIQHLIGGRPGEEHLTFPSTSTIAAASFKSQVLQKLRELGEDEGKKLTDALKAYVKAMEALLRPPDLLYWSPPIPRLQRDKEALANTTSLSEEELETFLGLDGEWLFKDSFTAKGIAYEYEIKETKIDPKDLEAAKKALNELLEVTDDLQIAPPRKYYALLYFDGDKISKWVSGENSPDFRSILHPKVAEILEKDDKLKALVAQGKKRPLGPASHLAISAAMKHLALDVVRPVVEDHHCSKLIYAGGDDVLAFMPVDELLPIMRELRGLFSGTGKMNDLEGRNGYIRTKKPHDTWIMSMGGDASASVGAVIAHHTHPFSQVVEEATKALKKDAKEKQDRNAWAIHLYKRSGAPLEVGSKWDYQDGALDVLVIIEKMTKLIKMPGKLSSKLAYDMDAEALGLAGLRDLEPRQAELKRLLGRHWGQEATDEEKTELASMLTGLLKAFDSASEKVENREELSWLRLMRVIRFARFLAEER